MKRGALILLVLAPLPVFGAVPLVIAAALETLLVDLMGVAVSVIVFYVSARAWMFARTALGMHDGRR